MKNHILFILWAFPAFSYAAANPIPECKSRLPQKGVESITQQICVGQREYRIEYKRNNINLFLNGERRVLERIPKRRDPTKIGATGLISFLPYDLQPYRARGILLYTSVSRSSGGSGGGQCGSGAEIYLNVLDISKKPRILSKLLVGSCLESIELIDQDILRNKLGKISVVSGQLSFTFLNYRQLEGSPTALLSNDWRSLIFEPE